MYEFRDVTETGAESWLPSEAVAINGEYIEDKISGYRTLYTKGREALKLELDTVDIGSMDGTKVKSSRYPEREITVGFQLVCAEAEEYREAWNELNRILKVKEAQFIFNDEADKYFTGTPYIEGDVDEGRNAVTGEWTIYCADPFKYSTELFTADVIDDTDGNPTMVVDYNGTVPAHPTFKTQFYTTKVAVDDTNATVDGVNGNEDEALGTKGQCGYVAFFDANKHILQFGNPDALAPGTSQNWGASQKLVSQSFLQSSNYSDAVKQLWQQNVSGASMDALSADGAFSEAYGTNYVPSGTTSGTIITGAKGSGSSPSTTWSATYKADGRTSGAVKLTVSITCKVGTVKTSVSKNWKKAKLTVGIKCKNTWHEKVVKKAGTNWAKGTHKATMTFSVSSLEAATIDIASQFRVNESGAKSSPGKVTARSGKTITIPTYTDRNPDNYYLHPSSYGTVTQNKWHGVTAMRTIPADASGATGATEYELRVSTRFSIGSSVNDVNQCGRLAVILRTSSNSYVFGVYLDKSTKGKTATVNYINGGTKTKVKNIDASYSGSAKDIVIRCIGGNVTMQYGGSQIASFTTYNRSVAKIVLACYQYGAQPPMDWIGFRTVDFTKHSTSGTKNEIPFNAGDLLVADGNTAEVRLTTLGDENGGAVRPDLGALGNDWETLVLTEGTNEIHTAYSDWAKSDTLRPCTANDEYQRTYYVMCDEGDEYDSETQYYTFSDYTAEFSPASPTEDEWLADRSRYYVQIAYDGDEVDYCDSDGQVLSLQPSYWDYMQNPPKYYIKEDTNPQFMMEYREVYL